MKIFSGTSHPPINQSIKSADSLKVCLTAQLDHPQNQTFAFHNEMKCTYIAEGDDDDDDDDSDYAFATDVVSWREKNRSKTKHKLAEEPRLEYFPLILV